MAGADTPSGPARPLRALAEAQERAAALHLHAHPMWLTLLHALPGRRPASLVDDPAFFLAATGKRDPKAELQATLEAFFAPRSEGQPHAAERFPARLEWLAEVLDLDREALPVPRCDELEAALADLEPRSAHLVFPAAYLNSPASAFGHTLLRIKGRRRSDLLDRAINYAAVTQETNGLVFAFKGLTGLYSGYYAMLPYYAKVQEYAAINQRDIWEYELDLTPTEVRRLVLHVWELRHIASDYYFLDENCSFNLLFLLDAARPGLDLVGMRRIPGVVPVETVRRVVASGLVREAVFRPSQATRVRHLAAQNDRQEQRLALSISSGDLPPAAVETAFPDDQAAQAGILDLAAADLERLRGRRKIAEEAFAARFHATLEARSRLGPVPAPPPVQPPARPETSHLPGRLALALGREGGRDFAEVGLRPVHHGLLDPPAGFLPGAEIALGEIALRGWESDGGITLQRLDAVRIRSYSPRDLLIRPLSWQALAAIRHEPVGDGRRRHLALLGGGAGGAWGNPRTALGWIIAEAELQAGDLDPDYAIGAGVNAGLLKEIGPWRLLPYGRCLWYGAGATHADAEIGLSQAVSLGTRQGLSLDLACRRVHHERLGTVRLAWWWFF